MAELETYITLQEAVRRYRLDAALLTDLVSRGKIQGGKLDGTLVLLEEDARRMAKY